MEGWILFFNGLTALSTFVMMIATGFMAFFAGKALDSWKNQQKRQKLVNLLESLNKYIQELQLYELESVVYSKQSKNCSVKDLTDKEFLNAEIKFIDNEMAEEFGSCILYLKNWLIDHEEQESILNEINKKMQEYRISIYNYCIVKKNYIAEIYTNTNILYGNFDMALAKHVENLKDKAIETREDLINLINKFKKLNKKLLK